MIKRRFKYALGTTLVTSSLVLLSHGHAFAATNDVDNQFNHDATGNPVTAQDNNNNVDNGFNHDVDANNNVDAGFNHDVANSTSDNAQDNATDAGYNHDINGNPVTAQDNNNNVDNGFNHDVDANNNVDAGFNHDVANNTSSKATPQDPSKSKAEENDIGFNGYPEQQGLVKESKQQSSTSQHPQKQQEPSTNTKAQSIATTSTVHNVSNSITTMQPNQSTTLSKQTSHSQQVNGASAQSTLPKTGESDNHTPLFVGVLALILGVSSLSLKRVVTKKQ
ncbi:LPXTG cell wall anchor domain-containing protein [Staphylococcus sp. NRL 16/872]|uniref:LPXTG cell wall anchor domain-containing protein n=1 Tax=Staphylococcus sp. NRL 16/872 TaxID=2930131 RepID=UPI001FB30453|nr:MULTISPECIES: LPXTG cell wall anchor domain-containing protein [unclassified Staphylococcus]MCJ1655392.1 LPXTG cell wall anchor domain-containing protein [Staphylococcus sp. NRL 21/187]MCJ1667117.1 LPXTG cell wall anchor domain-containing protein [Staphylococcus sp. NRL 19/737]WEN69599.1 LPXTG cell wall anchor domain-containing protein [Staphylococcus sp. NRL 16/872]